MRDPVDLARALCQGWVDAAGAPELADAETKADVRRRLGMVDHELVEVDGQWLALPSQHDRPPHGFVARNEMGELEHALICACYLHLVFLPTEHDQAISVEDPGIAVDEVVQIFVERSHGKGEVEQSLRRICQAGWTRRSAGRLYAEPPLIALDDESFHQLMFVALMRWRIERLGPPTREGSGI